ncbi:putative chemotaxis-related methyltranferase [Burkholderia cenocepacia H111]|nr:putative chemotaxis-related methyltranferase [Burkholderia cenocepacia H111]
MNVSESRFRGWLLRETGIDPDSLGNDFLMRALTDRIHAWQADGERVPSAARPPVTPEALDAYWQQLNASADERRALIELFVVPETWFFRDREAFATLARLAAERLAAMPGRVIRVLSAPCSTGEEPYSAAMALLDAGLEPASFAIDAIDLSPRAIEQARLGCYGRNAFRGTATEFRTRYFTPTRDGWLLDERVRACVQFSHANLVEPLADTGIRYDFVFCRNVLIYFDRDAQDRVIRSLDERLADDGVLFVGPAETGVAMRHGMRSARVPLAFAFHREPAGAAAEAGAARPVAPLSAAAPYRGAERFTIAPLAAPAPGGGRRAARLARRRASAVRGGAAAGRAGGRDRRPGRPRAGDRRDGRPGQRRHRGGARRCSDAGGCAGAGERGRVRRGRACARAVLGARRPACRCVLSERTDRGCARARRGSRRLLSQGAVPAPHASRGADASRDAARRRRRSCGRAMAARTRPAFGRLTR